MARENSALKGLMTMGAMAAALMILPSIASAHGSGGMGGGMGMGRGMGTGVSGFGMGRGVGMGMGRFGISGMSGNFGGLSMNRMSSRGLANTNGPNAMDRDMGVERAEQRMNMQGVMNDRKPDARDLNDMEIDELMDR